MMNKTVSNIQRPVCRTLKITGQAKLIQIDKPPECFNFIAELNGMEIVFILVEPAVPGNIGAAARAIKTMGFSELWLVNPAGHLSDEARWMAHASGDVLEHARIFPEHGEVFRLLDLAIATTAKKRSVKEDYVPLKELPGLLVKKQKTVGRAGILFGSEESGLPNDVIGQCDLAVSVPMVSPYPSLNLAQAVMVFAYELSPLAGITSGKKRKARQDADSFRILKERVAAALEKYGLADNPNLSGRIMERLSALGDDDIHLIHSIMDRLSGEERQGDTN